MSAVILCEFPSDRIDARSWILGRITVLAVNGQAELKFIGTGQASSDRAAIETIAFGITSIERGREILSEWRQDPLFSGPIETRLLQTENVYIHVPIFP